jgi:hypothetical protein
MISALVVLSIVCLILLILCGILSVVAVRERRRYIDTGVKLLTERKRADVLEGIIQMGSNLQKNVRIPPKPIMKERGRK